MRSHSSSSSRRGPTSRSTPSSAARRSTRRRTAGGAASRCRRRTWTSTPSTPAAAAGDAPSELEVEVRSQRRGVHVDAARAGGAGRSVAGAARSSGTTWGWGIDDAGDDAGARRSSARRPGVSVSTASARRRPAPRRVRGGPLVDEVRVVEVVGGVDERRSAGAAARRPRRKLSGGRGARTRSAGARRRPGRQSASRIRTARRRPGMARRRARVGASGRRTGGWPGGGRPPCRLTPPGARRRLRTHARSAPPSPPPRTAPRRVRRHASRLEPAAPVDGPPRAGRRRRAGRDARLVVDRARRMAPRSNAATGVPHASASATTSPNGSSHTGVTTATAARPTASATRRIGVAGVHARRGRGGARPRGRSTPRRAPGRAG